VCDVQTCRRHRGRRRPSRRCAYIYIHTYINIYTMHHHSRVPSPGSLFVNERSVVYIYVYYTRGLYIGPGKGRARLWRNSGIRVIDESLYCPLLSFPTDFWGYHSLICFQQPESGYRSFKNVYTTASRFCMDCYIIVIDIIT